MNEKIINCELFYRENCYVIFKDFQRKIFWQMPLKSSISRIVNQKSRSLMVFAPQDVLLIAYKLLHLKDATKLDKMLKIILDHIKKIRLKNPVKIREKYSEKNSQKKKL